MAYIIIGSGMGGGILARQLVNNGKKVTLYEKGDGAKRDVGDGSLFLWRRILFWSLEAPVITTALENFPPEVATVLRDETADGLYGKALKILANSPPGETTYPNPTSEADKSYIKENLDKLKGAVKAEFKPNTPIVVPQGAEFTNGSHFYYFPQSAYSTTDWLVEEFYKKQAGSSLLEIKLNHEITSLTLTNGTKVEAMDVKVNGAEKPISIDVKGSTIILCAGTSGKYFKPIVGGEGLAQPLELSCHVEVHGQPALLTICTYAEKFYRHGFAGSDPPKPNNTMFNILMEFQAPLNEDGEVILDKDKSPVLKINRKWLDPSQEFKNKLTELMKAVRTAFGFTDLTLKDDPQLAPWGSVAREVGTMRMDTPKTPTAPAAKGVVDADFKVYNVENLYVCDLSVFPFSPQANPSRTLTALAMRLGDKIGPKK